MVPRLESPESSEALGSDFMQRLEESLRSADHLRRRRRMLQRVRSLLPALLLIGPIVAWRLMLVSPDGVHVSITALAWVTFLLDVGVHVDSALLSYLGLSLLPVVVGVLLLTLITAWLLSSPRGEG
jgi:hypothetical protein